MQFEGDTFSKYLDNEKCFYKYFAYFRLRYQISIMEQCPVLSCRNCGELIARQDDIFSMSSEGPQGLYLRQSKK